MDDIGGTDRDGLDLEAANKFCGYAMKERINESVSESEFRCRM